MHRKITPITTAEVMPESRRQTSSQFQGVKVTSTLGPSQISGFLEKITLSMDITAIAQTSIHDFLTRTVKRITQLF